MAYLGEIPFSFENNVYFAVIFWYFYEYQIGHTVCVQSLTRPSRMGQHMAYLGEMPFSFENNVYFAVILWYFYKYQIGHTVCVIQIFNPYYSTDKLSQIQLLKTMQTCYLNFGGQKWKMSPTELNSRWRQVCIASKDKSISLPFPLLETIGNQIILTVDFLCHTPLPASNFSSLFSL